MKSLFFGWLLSILINTILCISVRDEFIILNEVVLNNEPAELYIASQTCSIRYTCKKYEEVSSWVIFTKAHLTDCYYRDRQYNVEFYPDKMVNLKECINHGRVTLKSGPCYLMSNGKETTYNLKNDKSGVIYYDIDWNYNRTLTEYGWCSFYGQKDIDANWMNCIDDNLPLNQINIPGSHDSGTFDVGKLSNDAFLNVVYKGLTIPYIASTGLSEFAQTQDLDITEQLEKGIRYLDVRLSSDNKSPNDLFLSHGKDIYIIDILPCIKSDDYTFLTFDDVISDCVKFLSKNSNEAIIMHIKEERISDGEVCNRDVDELDKTINQNIDNFKCNYTEVYLLGNGANLSVARPFTRFNQSKTIVKKPNQIDQVIAVSDEDLKTID